MSHGVPARQIKIIGGLGVVATFTVLFSCLYFKDAVLEQLYLRKLRRGDVAEQRLAAEYLGYIRSRRAICELIECLKKCCNDSVNELASLSCNIILVKEQKCELCLDFYFRITQDAFQWTEKLWPGQALVRIGPPAVPVLVKLLGTGDANLRNCVIRVLSLLEEDDIRNLVITAESSVQLQIDILEVLSVKGKRSRDVLPWLLRKLDDENGAIKLAAIIAVARIGQDAQEAIPKLKELLVSKDKRVACYAWGAMQHIAGCYIEPERKGHGISSEQF
jgi:HEAT repeat protein